MALVMNLEKLEATKSKLSMCLEKAGIFKPPVVELCFVLDVSRSYTDMHVPPRHGQPSVTEKLVERITPWGMLFDPDKKLDVVTFSNGKKNAVHVGAITEENYTTFIGDYVVECQGWDGGTDYSYAITKCLQLFGFVPEDEDEVKEVKTPGLFSRLFGPKTAEATVQLDVPLKRKSLVLFNTDGENSDVKETERVLKESEARGDQIYFIFLGVNADVRKFEFIQCLADKYSNVNFHHVKDYEKFVDMSDEDLNAILLTEEFLAWIAK